MKKNVIKLIDLELERMKATTKQASYNSLDSDARALIDNAISGLTELRASVEADPDVVGVDELTNKMRDIVDEKINAALEKVKDVQPVEVQNDYLASRQAVKDFARCLRSTNGLEQMRQAWGKCLSTNGVTFGNTSDAFLPALVKGKIDDLWNADDNWLKLLNNTGAKRFAIRYTDQRQDDEYVSAHWWTPSQDETKKKEKQQQQVTMKANTIEVQPLYKLQKLDTLTIFNDDGALIEWIADELTRQVYYTIGRNILIGHPASLNETSGFASLTNAGAPFVVIGASSNPSQVSLVQDVMDKLIAPIYDGRDVMLFLGAADLFELRRYIGGTNATPRYASIDEVKGMLGVSNIVVLPYLGGANSTRAIAMHPDRYYTVGNMTNFEYLRFPDHLTNSEYFRVETFVGGAPSLNCASILTPYSE